MPPQEVAEREAWEEAGVRGDVEDASSGTYRYAKTLESGVAVTLLVQVHLLKVSRLEEDFPEKGQRAARWFSVKDAAEAAIEPELKVLLCELETVTPKLRRLADL